MAVFEWTEQSHLESRPWSLDLIHFTLYPQLTEFHITVIQSSVGIHSLDVLLKDVAKNESLEATFLAVQASQPWYGA